MAFESDNQLGAKANHQRPKLFRNALLAELKRADGDVERLQRVARRMVEDALAGNVAAQKEIADRIDGKVPQAVVGDDEHDPIRTVTKIERVIVKAANSDSGDISAAPGAGEI